MSELIVSKISSDLLVAARRGILTPIIVEGEPNTFNDILNIFDSFGVKVYQKINSFNMVAGIATPEMILKMAVTPEVGYIYPDLQMTALDKITPNLLSALPGNNLLVNDPLNIMTNSFDTLVTQLVRRSVDVFYNKFLLQQAENLLAFPQSLPSPLDVANMAMQPLAVGVESLEKAAPFSLGGAAPLLPMAAPIAPVAPLAVPMAAPGEKEFFPTTVTRELLGVNQAEEIGITGKGVKIAVLDTGVDLLSSQISGSTDFDNAMTAHPIVDENGHGCTSPDSLVFTSRDGIERIEDFYNKLASERSGQINVTKTGDIIDVSDLDIHTIGWDEEKGTVKTKITHAHRIPINEEVTEIVAGGTSKFLTTNWHPFLVYDRRNNKPKYVRADKLNTNCCLITPDKIIDLGDNYIEPDEAYLLGYFIGNGSLPKKYPNGNYNNVSIHTGNFDEQLMAGRITKIGLKNINNKRKGLILIYSEWDERLVELGFHRGKKGPKAFIPKKLLLSKKETLIPLIAGLVDSDGSFDKKRARMRYVTVSKKLAGQLVTLLGSWGLQTRVAVSDSVGRQHVLKNGSVITDRNPAYTVSVLGASYFRLLELINPYLLFRKPTFEGAYRENDRSWLKSVKKVMFNGYFYDFTTETENYLAGESGVCFIHNTHCCSTTFGLGTINHRNIAVKGMAVDALPIAIKCLGGGIGTGRTSDIVKAMEMAWLKGAKIVSMSLGGTDTGKPNPMSRTIDYLTTKGMVFVVAGGNSGPDGKTIASPGSTESSITVGAVNPADDIIAPFSSRGPTLDGRIKPDICSYGVNVYSATSYGGLLDSRGDNLPDGYASLSGTSMATPHVAGMLALLCQLHPDITTGTIKSLFKKMGHPKDNNTGWGIFRWQWLVNSTRS